MANTIEIKVKVDGSLAAAEIKALESETKASADRQKSTWDTLGSKIGNVFKGVGGLAAGALGVGLTGPFAAAGLALAGFGAIAEPSLKKVETALTTTGKAGQKAWAALDPSQRNLAMSIRGLQTQFDGVAKSLEPVVTKVASLAMTTARDLLPALGPLAKAGASVISGFLTPLDKMLASPFFAQFTKQMSQLATEIGPVLGQALTGLLKVFMQMFEQAGPAAVKILSQLLPAIVAIASGLIPVVSGVTRLAAAFINWLSTTHLLIPALIAVGAAMTVAGGPISVVVAGVALMVGGLVHLWQTSQTFRQVVTQVFADVGQVVLTFAELWLSETKAIADVFLTTIHVILVGADVVARAIDFVMGTHLHDATQSAIRSFDSFKNGVDNAFNAAHARIEGWKQDLANMPKKVRLEGDITDLTAKLNDAKQQLKDPNLTKTRRAQIEANIAQLQAAIANARAQLDALNGKTATTYVVVQSISAPIPAGVKHKAAGGIVGAAGGGPRGNLVMVGEHGRELVRLPAGATVHSNPDTERMIAGGGGGAALVQLEITSGGQGEFEKFMSTWIKNYVRIKGGGNVQAAFGRH